MSINITIGADPEFFVQRRRHFVSAHPLNCGTKEAPKPTAHGAIQIDGVALECNVRPAGTREDFIKNVQGAKRDAMAELYSYDPTAKLVTRPSVFFGHRRLNELPFHVRALGCNADFNAYTLDQNDSPNPRSPFRTGSGHIHIGFSQNEDVTSLDYIQGCAVIAKELDYYLGLPSLLWDKDNRRRSLYGKAGSFRPKPYGLEYRVLSNAWVTSDKHIGWVYAAADKAARLVLSQSGLLQDRYQDTAARYINNNDRTWKDTYIRLAEEVLT